MWGWNPDSRLMLESSECVTSPCLTLMSELKKEDPEAFKVRKISLGVTHSGVVSWSGEVFTAGSKQDGQLGMKLGNDTMNSADIDENKSDYSSALNQVLPFGDFDNPKALDISCGDSFSLILDGKYLRI